MAETNQRNSLMKSTSAPRGQRKIQQQAPQGAGSARIAAVAADRISGSVGRERVECVMKRLRPILSPACTARGDRPGLTHCSSDFSGEILPIIGGYSGG
jgi:hypothetical protein